MLRASERRNLESGGAKPDKTPFTPGVNIQSASGYGNVLSGKPVHENQSGCTITRSQD